MNREPIYAKVFELVSAVPGVYTSSRKLKHWDDVPLSQQPAIFQAQQGEQAIRVTRQPTQWLISIWLYVYINTSGAVSPGEVLNPILDAIEAIFADPFPGVPQTLDGLCEYARIEGNIETFEGTLGDQEVAKIPIKILVP